MQKHLATLAGCLSLIFAITASAEVKPSDLFTDHMVLQRDVEAPVWGAADPGEAVKVTFNGQTRSTTASADGKWMLRLGKLKAGGPYEMQIEGKNSIVIHDVLVGEVWLATGQSNMVFTVSKKAAFFAGMLDEDKEIAAANYPQIRMFTEKTVKAYTPQDNALGDWKVCSPDTAGAFSAIGYLFARDLQQELHVPIGIVTVAFGASTAESWLPREAFAGDPQLKPLLDGFDARESYFRDQPHAMAADAPSAPPTLNARPQAPKAGPMFDPTDNQHEPTVMFNGMLHPVIPYAVRGAIWYQGESIVGGRAGIELYPHVMQTLVEQWRRLWGEGDFPFYAVQLAALKNVSNNPMVREQQAKILSLPGTGLAITIDVGDPDNVHPKDKEPVGQRLALIALAKTYGRQVEYSGPVYSSMKIEGSAIRIRFTHTDGGLVAKGVPLQWFQIAGADQQFIDADAVIDGSTVVVKSNKVPAPVAVRYAWANYPIGCNLYNAANLPAPPFRTDDWDALADIAKEFTGQ
jgi:sialate O-acetylesterase